MNTIGLGADKHTIQIANYPNFEIDNESGIYLGHCLEKSELCKQFVLTKYYIQPN